MKSINHAYVALILLAQIGTAYTSEHDTDNAATPTQRDARVANVQNKLKSIYPNTRFDQVRPTPVQSIYEVVMGRNVAFVDDSGRYFIFGRLFDMETQQDITYVTEHEPTSMPTKKVEFSDLPLDSAIKTVKGDGTRVLAVFSDPDCPYCKMLERSLDKIDNVTVYTFLMPLEQLHPQARAKVDAVWCSKDRATAWKTLMSSGKVPKAVKGCKAPHAVVSSVAEKLGVTGTPFLIAGDGRIMPGSLSADRLNTWLNYKPVQQVETK